MIKPNSEHSLLYLNYKMNKIMKSNVTHILLLFYTNFLILIDGF